MFLKFAFNTIKAFGILGGFTFNCDVWPFGGVFSVDLKPFVEARLGVWLYGVSWAFRLANATINAFIWMDNQHVFAFVEAIHRANFDAIHIFAFDAVFSDDVSHDYP
jgi:hypothetical protein